MPIDFHNVKGYYYLDVWVMANIIQVSTLQFCRRFLNAKNDPCHRLYDQMTMAARSVTANIAEGLSRRQTSSSTEMTLTDVARASLSELQGDYFFIALANRIEPWSKHSREHATVSAISLDAPAYTDDWAREAWAHILRQKAKFDPYTLHERIDVCVNSMLILCNRDTIMLDRLLGSQLDTFRQEGGFSENLTKERVAAVKEQASRGPAPECPLCGAPMVRKMTQRGHRQGTEFWGCTNFPQCKGVRPL